MRKFRRYIGIYPENIKRSTGNKQYSSLRNLRKKSQVLEMGGFAGGDEGGYWDTDILPVIINQRNSSTSKKKFDIKRNDFSYSIHPLLQEFHHAISFIPCQCNAFTIEGYDNIPLESSLIYKAFVALTDYTNDPDITEFFYSHKVVITKRMTTQADSAESAADAAAFMCLAKEACNLVLSTDELLKIGHFVSADVSFYLESIT